MDNYYDTLDYITIMSLDTYLTCRGCKIKFYIHNYTSTVSPKISPEELYKFLEEHRHHELTYHHEEDLGVEELAFKNYEG